MKELLKDELLFYLGELIQDYESCFDYFQKKKIHNKMEAVCLLLNIPNIKFDSITHIIKQIR